MQTRTDPQPVRDRPTGHRCRCELGDEWFRDRCPNTIDVPDQAICDECVNQGHLDMMPRGRR